MKKNHGGLVHDTIIPGDFYIATTPGGFPDRVTGIIIPGPTVNVASDGSRMVESVATLPEPVQLPHVKVQVDYKDKDRKIQERREIPFDRADETALHDGLNQALATGIIQHVSEEEMIEFHPETWANRSERLVFDNEQKTTKPMSEMISDFRATRAASDIARAAADQDIEKRAAAARAGSPPPPPPQK